MDKFVSQIRGIVQNEISFAKKAEMKSRIFKHYKIQQSFASVKFGFFRRLFLKQKLQFLHIKLKTIIYINMIDDCDYGGLYHAYKASNMNYEVRSDEYCESQDPLTEEPIV